jgi:tetratricopeptide (TPR) repeat protein
MPASAHNLTATRQRADTARRAGDFAQARALYLQALQGAPGDAELRLDAAAASLGCGDAASALQCVAPLGPELAAPLRWRLALITATACKRLQRADEALDAFRAALAQPDLPVGARRQARRELADLLLNTLGDPRAAAHVYIDMAVAPADASAPGESEDAALARLVAALYTGELGAEALAQGFRSFADAHLRPIAGLPPSSPAFPAPRRPGRRPRIGFVSPQFCASPVGFLTLLTLEALAREADLILFDRGAKPDWAQARFREAAAQWVPCAGLPASGLDALWRGADLDALVDLGGWMDLEALRALAGRPVGRQLKWVGGQSLSTGMACFDGFLADARQVPVASERLYTEPIRRFSRGYVTYASAPYLDLGAAAAAPPGPGPTPRRGAYALVSNPAKIGRTTVERLQRLEPRRLLLVDRRWAHRHARRLAEQAFGPIMDRVEFLTPASHPEYLQTLASLDATVVDTEPYAMGLTAIELRLLGKHVLRARRPAVATMRERHCNGHWQAPGFDHGALQAQELLRWCTA